MAPGIDSTNALSSDVSEKQAWLEDYWRELGNGEHLPGHRQIDPVALGVLLPHIFLLDVLNDPLDFRYRLVGGHIEDNVGRPLKGELVSAISKRDPNRTGMFSYYSSCVAERAPVKLDEAFENLASQPRELRLLSLPLADDGINVDILFVSGWFLRGPHPHR